jgi:hypothetical protein
LVLNQKNVKIFIQVKLSTIYIICDWPLIYFCFSDIKIIFKLNLSRFLWFLILTMCQWILINFFPNLFDLFIENLSPIGNRIIFLDKISNKTWHICHLPIEAFKFLGLSFSNGFLKVSQILQKLQKSKVLKLLHANKDRVLLDL